MGKSTEAYVKAISGLVLGLGALIWLIKGVPYTLVWLPVLMLIGGILLAISALRLENSAIDDRGDQFIAELKNREQHQD